MGRPKLEKFAALTDMSNVVERQPLHKGNWSKDFFGNNQPLVLELACGKGDYAIGMAKIFPEKNFIGVDIKGHRLFTAANTASKAGLTNVAFIREQIDHLENYFEEGEIDEIWITFPDPFLKNSRSRKRLTSEKFLPIYKKILKPGGLIHLKTDSTPLYLFTKEVIESTGAKLLIDSPNVYEDGTQDKLLMGIQTYYEKMHIADGRTIQYLCFRI